MSEQESSQAEKAIVIGSGFSGLSSACFLAQAGFEVHVLEKHDIPGGRARQYTQDGFVFDMGPSWYWMPDVFERFFRQFGKEVSEYYDLQKLSPAYSIIFENEEVIDIGSDINDVYPVFEAIEKGSGARLRAFLDEAKYKYDVGMQDLVYKPALTWTEFLDARLFKSIFQLGVFQSYASHVRKYFTDPRLIRIMEFPVLFLGGTPGNVPALYSLMAYAGLALGTWYPKGGMYKIVEGMYTLAKELGVQFHFNAEVTQIRVKDRKATQIETREGVYEGEYVIAAADYHHVEQQLLSPEFRMYNEKYWSGRVLAPSAMIYFLGINRKLPRLQHHNLFFDAPFDLHADAIYHHPGLPEKPLFYVCATSVTDPTVAPEGQENLFILVPLSTELPDTEVMRQQCFEKVMDRLEVYTGVPVRTHIVHKRDYAMQDFKEDYHALRGNAYGLANTLMQTAILKPRIKSKKVENLYFAGQLTVPGPGVPPALISGEIAANLIIQTNKNQINSNHHYAAASL